MILMYMQEMKPPVCSSQKPFCGLHGAQRRLLPDRYGRRKTVYRRFARWSIRGVWERLYRFCAEDPDIENLIIDSTVIRAHPRAAGDLKRNTARRHPAAAGADSEPKFISLRMHRGIR